MATLSGGQTIATVGLTAQENAIVSQILQASFTSTAQPTQVVVNSSTATVVTTPGNTPVLMGTFESSSISNQSITGSANTITQLNVGASSSGSLTNLVADNSLTGAVITGTSNNSVVGFIGGTNTSVVVGDAGTQFIDMSRSTQNATIVSGTGNDSVIGGSGNDSVRIGDQGVANGGGGADTLIGGTGTATLGGGGGADSIVAATGGGAIIGESGNDSLVAGAGKDVFIYTSGGGSDQITGFDPANDTLALANYSDIVAAGLTLQDVISRATVSGGNTIISMPDGSTITIAGVTGINVNWFTIK